TVRVRNSRLYEFRESKSSRLLHICIIASKISLLPDTPDIYPYIMSENTTTKFEAYLAAFDEASWLNAVQALAPSIHKVDRDAVQIWFRFNSLALFQYLESADDMEQAAKGVLLQGDFGLNNRIDSSHEF